MNSMSKRSKNFGFVGRLPFTAAEAEAFFASWRPGTCDGGHSVVQVRVVKVEPGDVGGMKGEWVDWICPECGRSNRSFYPA